jgi:hypothetical protein
MLNKKLIGCKYTRNRSASQIFFSGNLSGNSANCWQILKSKRAAVLRPFVTFEFQVPGTGLSPLPLRCSLYFHKGLTQAPHGASRRRFFVFVRFCEQAHTAPKNKKPPMKSGALVPGTGIEPALPCDNQILSLTRLPVPPSGPCHSEVAMIRGGNIT